MVPPGYRPPAGLPVFLLPDAGDHPSIHSRRIRYRLPGHQAGLHFRAFLPGRILHTCVYRGLCPAGGLYPILSLYPEAPAFFSPDQWEDLCVCDCFTWWSLGNFHRAFCEWRHQLPACFLYFRNALDLVYHPGIPHGAPGKVQITQGFHVPQLCANFICHHIKSLEIFTDRRFSSPSYGCVPDRSLAGMDPQPADCRIPDQ